MADTSREAEEIGGNLQHRQYFVVGEITNTKGLEPLREAWELGAKNVTTSFCNF